MFIFGSRNQRKNSTHVETRLASILNLELGQRRGAERRLTKRISLTVPVLVVPWADGHANRDERVVGLTKDIGDRSASVLLSHPPLYRELLIGFCASSAQSADAPPDVAFFVGSIRHNSALASGFWQIGLAFTEYANTAHPDQVDQLIPIASHLLGPGTS